jgi:hypothetical protein
VTVNFVYINGGTIGQGFEGGRSSRTSTNNIVVISNGEIKGDVLGGGSENGEARGNVVEIK